VSGLLLSFVADGIVRKEEIVMADIPTIDLTRTGANISKLRKAAGLTVHDLQMLFGFNSPQAIYKWQNGAALPTVDNLIVLAAVLHVHIDDILVCDHPVV
jgi:DNA-binding XRE family transcriptional regulator